MMSDELRSQAFLFIHHSSFRVHPLFSASRATSSSESSSPLTLTPPKSCQRSTRSSESPGSSCRSGERSEEHTSELQSRQYLEWRLVLEKINKDCLPPDVSPACRL